MMRQDRFTAEAQEVLAASQELVRRERYSHWDVEHVLMALLTHEGGAVRAVFEHLKVDRDKLRKAVGQALAKATKLAYDAAHIYTTPRIVRMLEAANAEAERLKDEYVGVEHLLIAIADEQEGEAIRILGRFGVDKEKIYPTIQRAREAARGNMPAAPTSGESVEKLSLDLRERGPEGEAGAGRPVSGAMSETREQLLWTLQQAERRLGQPDILNRQAQALRRFRQAEDRFEEGTRQAETGHKEATRQADALLGEAQQEADAARACLRQLGIAHVLAPPAPQPGVNERADALTELGHAAASAHSAARGVAEFADAIHTIDRGNEAVRVAKRAFSQLGDPEGSRLCQAVTKELRSLDHQQLPATYQDAFEVVGRVQSMKSELRQLHSCLKRRGPGPAPKRASWPWVLVVLAVVLLLTTCVSGNLAAHDFEVATGESEARAAVERAVAIGSGIAGFLMLVAAYPIGAVDLMVRQRRYDLRVSTRDKAIQGLEAIIGSPVGVPETDEPEGSVHFG